ncbi:MAG: FHA domain-containing protein [Syntrophobacterales bacterium]|nr:MAG: FHA domain-containing protein [Syntrophobacterales bacterium]
MKQGNRPTRPIPVFKSRKENGSHKQRTFGKLIVIYGDHLGKQYHLSPKRMLIGRTDRSDIYIDDSSVSRKHAVIERKDGRFILEDLKSTNGTFINGEFVDVRVLNHGDKIRIGNTVLQFIVDG